MKRMVFALALALVVLGAAGVAYVRLAPSAAADWHVDPLTAADPGMKGVLRTPASDAPAPIYPVSPDQLLAAFDEVVLATPKSERLAGSLADGHITYLVRTRWIGFPDYVSVKALPADDGATLAIYARARFGQSDLGTNAGRVDAWLEALEPLTQP